MKSSDAAGAFNCFLQGITKCDMLALLLRKGADFDVTIHVRRGKILPNFETVLRGSLAQPEEHPCGAGEVSS